MTRTMIRQRPELFKEKKKRQHQELKATFDMINYTHLSEYDLDDIFNEPAARACDYR